MITSNVFWFSRTVFAPVMSIESQVIFSSAQTSICSQELISSPVASRVLYFGIVFVASNVYWVT